MIKVLICLDDKRTTDVVKTAFKQFPSMTAYPVPQHKLMDLLAEPNYHAVVVDLARNGGEKLLGSMRAANAGIEVMTLIDRNHKERFNRLKVDLGIFSYIATPIDAFELARRIVRLEKHLIEKHPLGV